MKKRTKLDRDYLVKTFNILAKKLSDEESKVRDEKQEIDLAIYKIQKKPNDQITDEEKKELYSLTIRECIDLINEKLSDSDLEVKDKLLRVKDKLLNDKQNVSEDFSKNISKLIELKNTLKNS